MIRDPTDFGEGGVNVPARRVPGDTGQQDAVADVPELVECPPVVGPHPGFAGVVGVLGVRGLEEQGDLAWLAVVDELAGDAFPIHLGQPGVTVVDAPESIGSVRAVRVEHLVLRVGPVDHQAAHHLDPLLVLLGETGQEVMVRLVEIGLPCAHGDLGMGVQ